MWANAWLNNVCMCVTAESECRCSITRIYHKLLQILSWVWVKPCYNLSSYSMKNSVFQLCTNSFHFFLSLVDSNAVDVDALRQGKAFLFRYRGNARNYIFNAWEATKKSQIKLVMLLNGKPDDFSHFLNKKWTSSKTFKFQNITSFGEKGSIFSWHLNLNITWKLFVYLIV